MCQEKSRARWAEHRERSGDVGWPFGGRRVGESSLRRQRLLSLRASSRASPRFMADWSRVMEFQAGLWALKSPTRIRSFGFSKRRLKSGVYCGGQEECGGR